MTWNLPLLEAFHVIGANAFFTFPVQAQGGGTLMVPALVYHTDPHGSLHPAYILVNSPSIKLSIKSIHLMWM